MSRTMDIQIKRVYEPEGPDDGTRVLVDRVWPRGLSKQAAHADLWLKEAEAVMNAAMQSIGLKTVGHAADRMRLAIYLDEVKRSEERLKEIEHQITDLLESILLAEYILSIPGVGAVTCGVFLGELGNPDYFKDPGQIVKYASYDPKENDSGLYTGRKIISKKGRWLLRKYLYFMAVRVVHRNAFFKEYYERKQKGMLHPLTRKKPFVQLLLN